MENSTPFDLDQALWQWRASLQNLGGLHPDELEELEGHLRESVSALHAGGLAVQEAFLIATRRLGSERQLSDEFAKANPQRTWTERAMWMVAGVLVAYAFATVARSVSGIALNCVVRSRLNGHLIGAMELLAGWVIWTGAAATAYWFVSRHSSRRDRMVPACIRHPVLSGLGLFMGLECLQYLMRKMVILADPLMNFFGGPQVAINPQTVAILSSWASWGGLLTQLLWVAAGPLLAGYAWRKRGRPASELAVSPELQAGECEAARSLQGQGLSLDEASLVLARRRGHQEVVAPLRVLADAKGIWLERAAWMVAGVALSQCLEVLVLSLGMLPLVVARPAAPLYQHLTGLAAACLSLMLGGAFIAGLWRWVTGHSNQSASIGSVCRHRPFLSAIALMLVCVGIGFGEYGLFAYAAKRWALPTHISPGPIMVTYFTYSRTLTSLVIPIALLLWLARRWRSFQTNPAPCR